ncbi:MAG: murein L,D-transpeptidase, partial [Clostridia bacterium]|nr:murein L,D-transpeptidase [Clostridia bacterium]
GSSGDAVSKLQKRLRVLGFASIAVDGGYGASTKAAVETLQKYMREMESDALAAVNAEGADDGQLTVEVNGVADPLLLDDFYDDAFPAIPADMNSGSAGRDVVRLQRRLAMLEYYYSALDGQYGSGTASAVTAFQRRNDLPETGAADHATLAALFNENAKKALKPYVLKVSTADQRVYAYAPDRNGEYTELVRTMKCSTGRNSSPTPTGTFTNTGPGARWHYFKKFNCWAQYAYYIQGDILFHSVLYNQKNGPVTQSSVNHLGSKASHGCVRLSVEDAKWIWNNCPANTTVIVY